MDMASAVPVRLQLGVPWSSAHTKQPDMIAARNAAISDSSVNGLSISDLIMVVTSVLAIYNSIELFIRLFRAFHRRRGLYFWAYLSAILGMTILGSQWIALAVSGNALAIGPATWIITIFAIAGWIGMVTGHSLVLYSRLHLMLHNRTVLRAVLAMIAVNVVALHIPIAVLTLAVNANAGPLFLQIYHIYEKVQVCVFCLQELIISGLYIQATWQMLRTSARRLLSADAKTMMRRLLIVNVAVVLLDITVVVLEFTGLHYIQEGVKLLAYSLKLKFEFSILKDLVSFVRPRCDRSLPNVELDSHQTAVQPFEPGDSAPLPIGNQENKATGPWRV